MREFGLIEAWLSWYKADASRCHGRSKEKRIVFKALSIKDGTGSGLILLYGVSVAIVVFIGEHVYACIR